MPRKTPAASTTPLVWWRTIPFADLDRDSADAISRSLQNVEIFSDGRWRHAKSGDASAAVGCAVPLWSAGVLGPSLDAAMSAVLVCALRGDRAAMLVLTHASRTWNILGGDAERPRRQRRRTTP